MQTFLFFIYFGNLFTHSYQIQIFNHLQPLIYHLKSFWNLKWSAAGLTSCKFDCGNINYKDAKNNNQHNNCKRQSNLWCKLSENVGLQWYHRFERKKNLRVGHSGNRTVLSVNYAENQHNHSDKWMHIVTTINQIINLLTKPLYIERTSFTTTIMGVTILAIF